MNTKAEILAKKLLALAKQGVGGEALNAEMMLKRHCEKYGIAIEDLEGDEVLRTEFKYKSGNIRYRDLFFQVVANTIVDFSRSYYKRGGNKVAIDCTVSDSIEIKVKYEHYLKEFIKSEKSFFNAFVMAANLYGNVSESKKKSIDDLSPSELAELRKAQSIASNLNIEKHHKRIGNVN